MKPARMSCLFLVLMVGVSAIADAPDFLKGRPPMTKETRLQIIRLFQAELAFTRKVFPQGEKGLVLDPSGTIKPDNQELAFAVANQGVAARAGDRVQITNVLIKDHDIVFEINGGPKKKLKWYQRVQVSGMGGTTGAPVDAEKLNAKGSYLDLAFSKHVPEMNLEELKKLLNPVLDFNAKSAAQAYIETLPPKLQEAIKNHKVLVGMNREMVTEAMGRPPKKVREKDNGVDYEEWIYGEAPADVQFVRFVGDEVVQLKIMPVGGEKILKTEKEIQVNPHTGAATLASAGGTPPPVAGQDQTATAENQPKKAPGKPPTLRRPGEEPPPEAPGTGTPMPRKTDPNGTPGSWPDPPNGTGAPLPPGSGPGTIPKL
jgi:hypothetical protein